MYSASIAKLATLYASQEQVKLGKLSLDSKFEYKDNVNQFPNSYDPSGSGKLEKKLIINYIPLRSYLKQLPRNQIMLQQIC